MASSNACWGIEVGSHAIKALKLEATGEGCRLADWAMIPHQKVLSTPGVDANDVIRLSLGTLVNQVDLGKAQIAISVPGHSSFARFAKLPPVEPKKVGDIIKFEAAQQIPFPLEEVEWDYQTFKVEDSPELEVGIFAITKERINERLTMLEDVGITPNHVVLSPIAVYNALAYDLEFGASTPGTIVVDVGTTSTDLVIATPGRMWVRTFPLGGHQFTEALVNQFQLSYPKAEKLKREAQDTKHARQVFQAMRPVFTDLAQDIQRSIGYFQTLHPDAELTRVIGVGETWRLPGLRKYLKQQLGLDVYRIESFKKIGTGGGASSGEDSEEGGEVAAAIDPNDRNAQFNNASLAMGTAYGLALHGLGLNAVKGNLMPTTILRKSMWKDKGKWFALAAGVAAAAGAGMFITPLRAYFAQQATRPDPMIASTVSQAQQLQSRATQAEATKSGESDLRAANLAALLENRDAYQMVVRDVQSMFAFTRERAKNWSPGQGQAPVQIPDDAVLKMNYVMTTYVPPAAPGTEAVQPEDAFMVLSGDLAQYPSIEVRAQFQTGAPEAQRFFTDTVTQWLRTNAKRADVPYELVFGDFLIGDERAVPGGARGAAPTPGGRLGAGPTEDRETGGTRRSWMGGGGARTGGGAGESGEGAVRSIIIGEARSGGDGSLEGLAPLPQPPASTGQRADAVFVWRMVFKPKDASAEGGAGSGPDAGGQS